MSDGIRFSEDQSLQAWGDNLKGAGPSAEEVAAAYATAEALASEWRETMGRIRDQGETDLPATSSLTSEIDSLHTRAGEATTADAWRGVAGDADTLHPTYLREHSIDEDRLRAPRTSVDAEMRADVFYAKQDT